MPCVTSERVNTSNKLDVHDDRMKNGQRPVPLLSRALAAQRFRDWAAARTNFRSEVAEMALAHAVGDKVEAAYRRGELLEKWRRLMAEWATSRKRARQVVRMRGPR